jgi:cytochrome P450
MVENPEVQHRAQKELDRVIGRDRLPDFSDKESLPYMFALYQEVLRWAPILPLGVAHGAIREDEYKGMRIPAGSIIFANIW